MRVAGQPVLDAEVGVAARARRPGTSAGSRRTRSSRSPASRSARSRLALDRELGGGRRARRWPGCRGCRSGRRAPGRRRAAPASSSMVRPSTSSPTPSGPPILWPVTVIASRPLAAKSTGSCPKACTASEWIGTPYDRAIAASSAIGCTVPTSLLAHITRDQRDRRGVGGDRRLAASPGATRPAASTGSHSTTAPSCSASHSAGSITAWCSTALARMRRARRVGAAARPVQALDREVVRLGAAAGEQHLARAGAEGRGEASRATPRPGAGRAGRRRAATTGCRRCRGTATSPRPPRGPSAWSPRGRGRQ